MIVGRLLCSQYYCLVNHQLDASGDEKEEGDKISYKKGIRGVAPSD